MPFLLAYVAFAALAIAVLIVAARRTFPSVRRTWLGVIAGAVAIAMTPLPVRHGGVSFLLPTMIVEGVRELRQTREMQAIDARDASDSQRGARSPARFQGYLPDATTGQHWRDEVSGLVWSDGVRMVPDISPDNVSLAQTSCAAFEPRGYWALPRAAEFYFLARAGRLEGRWLTDLFVMPGGITVGAQAGRGSGNGPGFAVRCVAVTPPAPPSGYLTSDIPLDDWNRYQLGLPIGSPGIVR